MATDDERIATLRWRCIERKEQACRDNLLVCAASMRGSEHIASWQVRKGLLTRDTLAAVEFALDDLELLAGRRAPCPNQGSEEEHEAAHTYWREHVRSRGQTGHCELDLSRLFAVGVAGLREDIAARLSAASGEQKDAYQSFLYALDGFSTMIEHAHALVQGKMEEADAARREELAEMAESLARVAHEPPATFRDAIQLLWLVDFAVMVGEGVGLVVPGHIDRTLRPFYEADQAAGRITRDKALVLVESLYLLINELIPDGLAMSVMVGGRDAAGTDVTNELSYLGLEAVRRTKLIYPTVGICWHEGTPRDLTALAIELIGKGYSTPAFFGDETIQRGLKELGAPPEQACNYINSTCVEITPVGASNVWVASPYFPLCQYLLEEIAEQVTSGAPAATFEAFVERYHERLARHIAEAATEENRSREHRRVRGRKPLQSVFTRDCIARGKDVDDGGAVYNWVECSFVGLANLADSMNVIREEVYRGQQLTLAEMKALLDANFAGSEPIRIRFLQTHAKYGNDSPEVDALVQDTVNRCVAACAEQTMLPDGSPFVPGSFCWVMHEFLGRKCGATPDGRQAGFPFADGCGPAQGRERTGPTAAVLSTTSWNQAPFIGGAAYNMKFNQSLFQDAEAHHRLGDLVTTFLRRGGFETQINVVDKDVLRKAQESPEHYRDLLVRIGGYCDYFTRLSPEMQAEILLRTEFDRV